MEPRNELEQENAALVAEQAALKRKVRALEEENAVLKAPRVLLERRLAQAATDMEVPPQAKGPAGPDPGGSD